MRWYAKHRRRLPWRAAPGEAADPYVVWLSEVMLQQTTVAAAEPYFRRFVERWPTVEALAAAPLDNILHGWQGLGYYARARNLHRCARHVVERLAGRFPTEEAELRKLPGVGAYTAGAVAAIAFGRPAVVVDANVERVIARLYNVEEPLPAAKARLRSLAARETPRYQAGDYAQAVMDLGATVCRTRAPLCQACPVADKCAGRAAGAPDVLPRRTPKAARPIRRAVAFWITDLTGAVLLRRRPERGLLGGMMEVPSSAWTEAADFPRSVFEEAPMQPDTGGWQLLPELVRHTFTHFHLELQVAMAQVEWANPCAGVWCLPETLPDHALPSVMKKVISHVTAYTGRQ